ncbi:MAG: hypothetical protein AAF466_12475 [Bacteroidota bacterium]
MNKRIVFFLIGAVLLVVAIYGLYDVIQELPVSSPGELSTDSMPENDRYLTKILGTLALACGGMVLMIMAIIGLIRDQNNKENS